MLYLSTTPADPACGSSLSDLLYTHTYLLMAELTPAHGPLLRCDRYSSMSEPICTPTAWTRFSPEPVGIDRHKNGWNKLATRLTSTVRRRDRRRIVTNAYSLLELFIGLKRRSLCSSFVRWLRSIWYLGELNMNDGWLSIVVCCI